MNLHGSYIALRNNSKSAMLAAIEIYNKPKFAYRDECFTILLVNAWELLLKALLSKSRQRIFYPKVKGQLYRTLSLQDALERSRSLFPAGIEYEAVAQNVRVLVEYRNNIIHFYNQEGFDVIIYGLAQTSIVNYRDLISAVFGIDVTKEMNIGLLPLSLGTQPDPVEFLQRAKVNPPRSKALAQFLAEVSKITQDLEARNLDTGRFLTVFRISFQSVKKVSSADAVFGVQDGSEATPPPVVERRVDPNISHPERRKSIMAKIGDQLNGVKFTEHSFDAIIWKYDIKNKPHLCWRAANGGLICYSPEVVSLIKKLTPAEFETAVQDYKNFRREQYWSRKNR